MSYLPWQYQALHQKLGKSEQAMKILGFYCSGEPEIEEQLDVWLCTSLHTAVSSFSLWLSVIGIYMYIGIEWRGFLSSKHAVLRIPPKTHLPRILHQFYVTLLHVYMHYSKKQNTVAPLMTSQTNLPHSSLLLSHGRRKG